MNLEYASVFLTTAFILECEGKTQNAIRQHIIIVCVASTKCTQHALHIGKEYNIVNILPQYHNNDNRKWLKYKVCIYTYCLQCVKYGSYFKQGI